MAGLVIVKLPELTLLPVHRVAPCWFGMLLPFATAISVEATNGAKTAGVAGPFFLFPHLFFFLGLSPAAAGATFPSAWE
jgi:hypothetical protein